METVSQASPARLVKRNEEASRNRTDRHPRPFARMSFMSAEPRKERLVVCFSALAPTSWLPPTPCCGIADGRSGTLTASAMGTILGVRMVLPTGAKETPSSSVRSAYVFLSAEDMATSLRTKLIAGSLGLIIIYGLLATIVGTHLIGTGIIGQAQEKVRTDLNSARYIFRDEIGQVEALIALTAERFFMRDALSAGNVELLKKELERIRQAAPLDILTLTDKTGRVIVRSRRPDVHGDSQTGDKLVNEVLSTGEVVAGTVIVPRTELLKEGDDLARQAHIEFIPTPMARPRAERRETSGMMIKAAAPVLDHDGTLIGVLYGGNILNRDCKVVDKIKETVYQGMTYEGKDIGTATVFQGDLRISTNVKQRDGSRAIGTRVSREVADQVLTAGLPWIGRAFVVDDWYIAAYEPIRDPKGDIIGILYVGLLEKKFADMRKEATFMFLGVTLAGMVLAVIVSCFLAGGLLKPIKRLVFASQQLAAGDLEHRVEVDSNGEIRQLAETFNFMASALKGRDEQLREHTHQQLVKSERLATLGQLAAGVAHEINNPLGAVLMYTHLSLEEMEAEDPGRQNLRKAVTEATRCKDIVKGLLDFARQTEPKIEQADVNEILERTLSLVEKQALFHNVRITRVLSPDLPKIMIDAGQIQQVFTNIILNAAEAMEGEGDLTVTTRMSADSQAIECEFTDTGSGILPENLGKLFDPFFTTKEVGRGTGLGLAVSYGIITRHKGTIDVDSEPGKGTTFTVRLLVKQSEN